MGHANVRNLSTFFVRRLYAKGKLSIGECLDAMIAAGEVVHASEGNYDDRCMLSMSVGQIVAYMLDAHEPLNTPIIEPKDLTSEQKQLFDQWLADDIDQWEINNEGTGKEYEMFDSIKWGFSPGWRKLYPKSIPILSNVSN